MIDYDKEDDDPIVAEVRRARERYAAQFNYDLEAIVRDVQRRTDEARAAGHAVVSLRPRRPEGTIEQTKRAG